MNANRYFGCFLAIMATSLLSGCVLGPADYRAGPYGALEAKEDIYAHCRTKADALPTPQMALQDPFLGSYRGDLMNDCMQAAGYYRASWALFP